MAAGWPGRSVTRRARREYRRISPAGPPRSPSCLLTTAGRSGRAAWGARLMACRRCAAARVIPATAGRAWLLAAAGRIRRLVPFGPVRRPVPAGLAAGHPESMTAVLPAEQEDLLAALDAEIFPDQR